MSDLAIAAVTATLRNVLASSGANITVTTLPPDRANQGGQGSRLNLFLYHVSVNAAWRNREVPTKVKPGETGRAPLALTLHYMLTAFGDDPADEADHRLLGTGMRLLHDHPLLLPDQIREAYDASRPRAQDERMEPPFEAVRLTLEPPNVEEMSKLWTTFQTQYRVSASYQASPVLLESQFPLRKPLPVLMRGEDDRGPDVSPAFPMLLKEIEYRDWRLFEPRLPAAQLGDVVTVIGERLPGRSAIVLIRDPSRTPSPSDPEADVVARLQPEPGSDDERLYVRLDPAKGTWVSGNLELLVEQIVTPDGGRKAAAPKRVRSRPLQLALAPRISDGASLNAIVRAEDGVRKLIVRCDPPVHGLVQPGNGRSAVSLLLTPLSSAPPPAPVPAQRAGTDPPAVVKFVVDTIPPGEYRVRLRVESVETLMMKRVGTAMDFDDVQKVLL